MIVLIVLRSQSLVLWIMYLNTKVFEIHVTEWVIKCVKKGIEEPRSRRMPSQTTFLFLCPSELHRRGDFVYARFSNHGAFVPKKMDVFYAQYLHRYSSSGINCSHPQTRNIVKHPNNVHTCICFKK